MLLFNGCWNSIIFYVILSVFGRISARNVKDYIIDNGGGGREGGKHKFYDDTDIKF